MRINSHLVVTTNPEITDLIETTDGSLTAISTADTTGGLDVHSDWRWLTELLQDSQPEPVSEIELRHAIDREVSTSETIVSPTPHKFEFKIRCPVCNGALYVTTQTSAKIKRGHLLSHAPEDLTRWIIRHHWKHFFDSHML